MFKMVEIINCEGRPCHIALDHVGNAFYQKAIAVDNGSLISLQEAAQKMFNMSFELLKPHLVDEYLEVINPENWPEILEQQGFRIEFNPKDFHIFQENMAA